MSGSYYPDLSASKDSPDVHKVRVVASECDLYGHDYQVNEYGITATGPKSREPSELFCSVCGKSWKVER